MAEKLMDVDLRNTTFGEYLNAIKPCVMRRMVGERLEISDGAIGFDMGN
jgi:hypothetical protein